MAFINSEAIDQSLNELGNEIILTHVLSESINLETDEVSQGDFIKKAYAKIRFITEKDRPLTELGFRPQLDVVIEFSSIEHVELNDTFIWNSDNYKINKKLPPGIKGGNAVRNRFAARLERP